MKIGTLHTHFVATLVFFLVVLGFVLFSSGQVAHANSKDYGVGGSDGGSKTTSSKDTSGLFGKTVGGPTYNAKGGYYTNIPFMNYGSGGTGRLESLQSQLQATLDRIAKLRAQIAGLNGGETGTTTASTSTKPCSKEKRCGSVYALVDVSTITYKNIGVKKEGRATTTQYIVKLTDGKQRVFVNRDSAVSPYSERFVSAVRKTGYTGDIAKLLAKATPYFKPAHTFVLTDVKTVTYKVVDPIPGAVDDEYNEYTITLKLGQVIVVKGHAGRGTEAVRFAPFRKAGFRGDTEALMALATQSQVLGAATSRVGIEQLKKIEALQNRITVAKEQVDRAVARLAALQAELEKLVDDTPTETPTKPQTKKVVINAFTATPSKVTAGQKVTFTWTSNVNENDVSQYGGFCSIEGRTKGNVAVYVAKPGQSKASNGTVSYTPTETGTYTLFCTSGAKDGSPSARAVVTVAVSPVVAGGGGSSSPLPTKGDISIEPISTSKTLVVGPTVADNYGEFSIEFDVTAVDTDVYIKKAAVQGAYADGAQFVLQNETGATKTGNISATLSASADLDSGYYVVPEGEAETFTLTVTYNPPTTGFYAARLSGLQWSKSIGGAVKKTVPTDAEFTTKLLNI